jgi:hypothetical protein
MKKMFYFEVPHDERGNPLIGPEVVSLVIKSIKKALGDEYVLVSSPFDSSCFTCVDDVIVFDENKIDKSKYELNAEQWEKLYYLIDKQLNIVNQKNVGL